MALVFDMLDFAVLDGSGKGRIDKSRI